MKLQTIKWWNDNAPRRRAESKSGFQFDRQRNQKREFNLATHVLNIDISDSGRRALCPVLYWPATLGLGGRRVRLRPRLLISFVDGLGVTRRRDAVRVAASVMSAYVFICTIQLQISEYMIAVLSKCSYLMPILHLTVTHSKIWPWNEDIAWKSAKEYFS